MAFDTRNGTRGVRQPAALGGVMKWMNGRTMKKIRSKGGKVMGMDALVLTTVGKKTGAERSAPVGYFEGEGDTALIVASAAGAAKNPAWYYNIAAHPDQVRIEMGGKKVDVTASQLHGQEREQAWQKIVAAAPRFGKYQEKTDRELPVIRLTPREQ